MCRTGVLRGATGVTGTDLSLENTQLGHAL
jgi:hypothetical protein